MVAVVVAVAVCLGKLSFSFGLVLVDTLRLEPSIISRSGYCDQKISQVPAVYNCEDSARQDDDC